MHKIDQTSMKGHLTRVTKFEEAHCNNKAHMCNDLYHEGQHMALVGQTRGVVKLWEVFFLIRIFQTHKQIK